MVTKEQTLRRRASRRVWGTGIVLGIVLVFLAGVIWWGLAASNDPQFQNQISMPSMRGTDTYLVNMWLGSSPAHVGSNRVTTQVTSTIGTATPLDSVVLHLTGPGSGAPLTVTTTPDSAKTDGFSAPVQFDSAGRWQITVEIHNGDVTRTTTFTITVS
ncbi:MAG: hypothetical protein WBW04_04285 [Nitrolancea sp.]